MTKSIENKRVNSARSFSFFQICANSVRTAAIRCGTFCVRCATRSTTTESCRKKSNCRWGPFRTNSSLTSLLDSRGCSYTSTKRCVVSNTKLRFTHIMNRIWLMRIYTLFLEIYLKLEVERFTFGMWVFEAKYISRICFAVSRRANLWL